MKKPKTIVVILGLLGIVLLTAGALVASFLLPIFRSDCQNPEVHELISVFAGGPGRIAKGFELLAASPHSTLFLSGVGKNSSLEDIVSHTGYSGILKKEHIVLDRESQNTEDNVRETLKLLGLKNAKSVTIVTSNIHYPRARLIFEKSLPPAVAINYGLICELSAATAFGEGGQDLIQSVFSEMAKYLYFWLHINMLGNSSTT